MLEATALNSGYFRVIVNGTEVSQHLAEREAEEKAMAIKAKDPALKVSYRHDYEVEIRETEKPLAAVVGQVIKVRPVVDPAFAVAGGFATIEVKAEGEFSWGWEVVP